jgi:integrase
MICMIYRRKRTTEGKTLMARLYRGRYRLEGDTKITEIPLHTPDKRVAQQRLEQIVRDKQMEQSGILAPSAVRKAAQSSLDEHLGQYVADLQALKRDDQYIYELKNRVRRLIKECTWKQIKDVTADSFQTWRATQTLSPKTINEYLGSVSSLLNWMEKHERIARNPLQHVQKVQANGRQVRPRRAFADAEMQRLLAIAGARKVVYLTAVYTGLRRSELAAVERGDLHLEGEKPFINVRASTTKNHQQAIIALHPELVAELRLHVSKLPAGASGIFAGVMPTMKRFKADLSAAGIEFINAAGHRADFHSLRHTLATNLARAGTAPRVAMEIMRHSDMRLTAKTYTDAGLLPVADAVLKLPFLANPKATSTQIGTQNLFRARHDLSIADTTLLGIPRLDLTGNQQVRHEIECPDQTGQNLKMVRGTGFEPVTPTVSV